MFFLLFEIVLKDSHVKINYKVHVSIITLATSEKYNFRHRKQRHSYFVAVVKTLGNVVKH